MASKELTELSKKNSPKTESLSTKEVYDRTFKTNQNLTAQQQYNENIAQSLRFGNTKALSIALANKPIQSTQDAQNFINSEQDADIAATSDDAPPTRGSLVDTYETLTSRSSILPTTDRPALPNFEQTFQELRAEYGVNDLESTVNDLNKDIEDTRARLRQRTNQELGKTVAMNVISGRVSETERQEMERLDFLGRQLQYATAELQTANSAIELTMNFRKMDYEAAKADYDTRFQQNVQMFNVVRGIVEYEDAQVTKLQDNARANLQIIYSTLPAMGDVELDPALQAKISSLELQSGLPQGFYENIRLTAEAGSEILSTTTRESGNQKYADVITRNPDGSIAVESVYLGQSSSSSGGSADMNESEKKRYTISTWAQVFQGTDTNGNPLQGQDDGKDETDPAGIGLVSPQTYKQIRQSFVSQTGYTAEDFDDAYLSVYLKPEEKYLVTGY